eukprot:32953-Pelagomonas_calceolata.AAC.4
MTEFLASTGADVSHLSADAANLGPANKGSSQYRGVSWHERSQRWEVRLVLHFILASVANWEWLAHVLAVLGGACCCLGRSVLPRLNVFYQTCLVVSKIVIH